MAWWKIEAICIQGGSSRMYAIGCVLQSLDFANFLPILCREARPRFRSVPRLTKWKMPIASAGSVEWRRDRMPSYWATALRRQQLHHQGEEALTQADGWCHDLHMTLNDAGESMAAQNWREGGGLWDVAAVAAPVEILGRQRRKGAGRCVDRISVSSGGRSRSFYGASCQTIKSDLDLIL